MMKCTDRFVVLGGVGAVFLLTFTSLTLPDNQITIYDGDEVYCRYTPYTDFTAIMEDLAITLGEHDDFSFSEVDANKQGSLIIKRAFTATVVTANSQTSMVATNGTVADILRAVNVDYHDNDIITPELTEQPSDDVTITLKRVTFEQVHEIEYLPFEHQKPDTQPKNTVPQVVQKGEQGENTITKQTRYIDGIEADTTVVEEKITKQPVDEIVQYVKNHNIGVSVLEHDSSDVLLDENGIPLNYSQKITGKATAYSALGKPTKLVPGCVAMDFSQYPKGTKLYIRTPDGSYIYGYSKVADTGSFVHNGSGVLVDLFYNSYAESARFGVKTVDIYILE